MKNILLSSITLLLLLVSQSVKAQGTDSDNPKKKGRSFTGSLSGKVTDKSNGNPLPGVTIYIPDLKVGAVTDAGGNYTLKYLPAGSFLVEVRMIGYKTVTMNVTITNASVENFELEINAVEESEVVITGLSKATQIKRNPVPIISISHDFISKNLSTNIIDAIAKVPGVNTLTTGPNVSKPFIRGLGYNRILTLYDGVRQEGEQWGDEHGIEIDQYGIDRIEVIKGPASLSYGSDALAGVVNLIPFQPAPDGKIKGDILGEYQTNNGMFGGSAMLSGSKNGFEWMGRISHKQATNYQDKYDGRVYNTGFNETDASASFGLHGNWGFSHLNFTLYNDLQEIPDGSRDSATGKFTKQITEDDLFRPVVTGNELRSYKITPLHQHVQNYRVYSANSFSLGSGRLIFNLGYQRSVRREFSHPEVPYQDVAGLFLQLNSVTYDVKYDFHDFNGWNLTAGINGMYQHDDVTKGTEFIIPTYHQFDIGPFVLLRKTINKMDLAGGLRFDSRSFGNQELYSKPDPVSGFDTPVHGADTVGADHPFYNYSHTFTGFSSSIGATYNFNKKFSVKLNIANGYRAPNISEISANGVHPGTNIYQIGNKNFKPEFSFQQDLGFAYSSSKLVVNFSIFNNRINNYIYNQKLQGLNGGDSVIVGGNQTYEFQQGKADLYGGELSIDIHPIPSLHFENSLSVVYAKNKSANAKLSPDSSRYLPFIPPFHGISELRYDFNSKAKHIVDGFVKVQLAYTAAQNRVYLTDNTETPTPGYSLFNAGIGAGITDKKGKTIFNISLMGNNLFDLAYQDHLSRLKYFTWTTASGYTVPGPKGTYGIYNMGRNIQFKIDFPLSFDGK
jgi:iron complex outermembrane receptor protein